jgi:hypothetical protein
MYRTCNDDRRSFVGCSVEMAAYRLRGPSLTLGRPMRGNDFFYIMTPTLLKKSLQFFSIPLCCDTCRTHNIHLELLIGDYSSYIRAGRSGDRIPVEARFSAPVQTGPGVHTASCTRGTGSFPGVRNGRDVTLTPHPLSVPWS